MASPPHAALSSLAGPSGISGAAVFVDYENLYYFLRTHYFEPPDGHELVQELLRRLRQYLAQPPSTASDGVAVRQVVASAYADFERLPSGALSALYLQGIEPHHVAGSDHKNAADMRLCVDAVATHYTRPEITTFVFAAGDRDYIPVLQHLQRQGRHVRVVAFTENLSGDLRANLDANQLLDAFALFDEATQRRLRDRRTAGLERRRVTELLRTQGLPSAGHLLNAASAPTTDLAATDASADTTTPPAESTSASGEPASEPTSEPGEAGAAPATDTESANPEPDGDASTPTPATDPATDSGADLASRRPRSTSQIVVRPGPAFGGVSRPPSAAAGTAQDRNWIAPGTGAVPIFGEAETEFAKVAKVRNDAARSVLDAIVHYAPRFPEKFMVPLSRHLREALPALAEFERKRLINDLVLAGALRLARRIDAQGNVMTVVVTNMNHPDIREMHPGN